MNLHVRDPRALELAQKLSEQNGVSIDEAVISALEAQLESRPQRLADRQSLPERLKKLADELARSSGPDGRDLTKDEVDRMWGHD